MPLQPTIQEQTQLVPLSLVAPAFKGLNLEGSGGILGPEWATTLDNFVFDTTGRPASRRGWLVQNATGNAATVKQVFEYRNAAGTAYTISSHEGGKLYEGTTDRTGTVSFTDGNVKFANFNDSVYAFGLGTAGIPVKKTGTGNFADITVTSGTAPTSTIGAAALGRLWGVDTDGKTLRFSALLDETRWDSANGGGSIDFSKVWPSGQDEIVAIEEFGGDIVVFGTRDTVVLSDSAASELTIDPSSMYVSDTLPGVGAVSQFAIARAAGDLWVLTRQGIVTLRREIVQKSTPINNVSRHTQSQLITLLHRESDFDDITMVYYPRDSFVLAIFPSSNYAMCWDTRSPMEDGTYRASSWSGDFQTAAYFVGADALYGSLTDSQGDVMKYAGSADDGSSFAVDYESGWLDLGQELNTYIKLIKRMTSFVYVANDVTVTHKVEFDFGNRNSILNKTALGGASAQWGSAEWGSNGVRDVNDTSLVAGTDIAEWSGSGTTLRTMDAPLGGNGQYLQVGLRLDTASGEFALQQINLFAKVGRLAT